MSFCGAQVARGASRADSPVFNRGEQNEVEGHADLDEREKGLGRPSTRCKPGRERKMQMVSYFVPDLACHGRRESVRSIADGEIGERSNQKAGALAPGSDRQNLWRVKPDTAGSAALKFRKNEWKRFRRRWSA